MKQAVLGFGLSGLVGTRLTELLSSKFTFENNDSKGRVDITNEHQVYEIIKKFPGRWIIHFAAKTDVDGCEKDKDLGDQGEAWKINVVGTQNISDSALKYGKKVLYVSTDFVFDGTKEFYTEDDTPNPINWYGQTKYEGEKIISRNPVNCIIRISYPYKAKPFERADFVHAIALLLNKQQEVQAVKDQIFSPTLIDDIVIAIERLIEADSHGIFHVCGGSSLTPHEAVLEITKKFGYSKALVKPVSYEEFYKDKAKRPYNLRIKNDKINSLGVETNTFLRGLDIIKKQGFSL